MELNFILADILIDVEKKSAQELLMQERPLNPS
jgi:hypothetical protein